MPQKCQSPKWWWNLQAPRCFTHFLCPLPMCIFFLAFISVLPMGNPLINPLFKGILAWVVSHWCHKQGRGVRLQCRGSAPVCPAPGMGWLSLILSLLWDSSSPPVSWQPSHKPPIPLPEPFPPLLLPAPALSPSLFPVRVGSGRAEGLPWPRSPSRGRGAALPPGWAPLQPKQGRSSNPLRVGSGGRSRVSLSQLRELIIPRELLGAAGPLLPPSTSTHHAPAAPAVPPGRVPSPAPPTPGSALGSCWGEEEVAGRLGPGQRFKTIKRRTGGCPIARCWRLISLLLQIIRSCDCLIDHMIV